MSTQNEEQGFGEQKLIDHLGALRKMLIHCIVAVTCFFPVGFLFAPHAINALVSWSFPDGLGKLNYFAPMEVLVIQLKFGALLAIVMSFPYIMRRIWEFLLPALYENEKRILQALIFASTLLFLSGVAFCVLLILPVVMKFSAGFSTPNIQPMLGIGNFLNLCAMLALAFGIMFQVPLVVIIAVKMRLVSVEMLKNARPYIVVGILILAGIFSPPDIISQLTLAVPTYLLFEVGLVVAKLVEKTCIDSETAK